ncbi:MAG: hypothetical protein ABR964_06600 [Tepidisphaeraceae bacterium]|jgi:hypothetical protein
MSTSARTSVANEPAQGGVFPAIFDAYRNQGHEQGYARGASDTLAGVLEAVEAFLRQTPPPTGAPRELLYAFGKFVERYVPHPDHHQYVSDGLGI